MIQFTKQKRLGAFGARWGCYATVLINIIESEKTRRLTDTEIYTCVGAMFLSESILMANYKDHKRLMVPLDGWSNTADPEFHFYVKSQRDALRALMDAFHTPNLKFEYEILMLTTQYGPHFVLSLEDGLMVNPDPGISGEITQRRELKI